MSILAALLIEGDVVDEPGVYELQDRFEKGLQVIHRGDLLMVKSELRPLWYQLTVAQALPATHTKQRGA
jgi:hypothetical protein